ncbi:hypothetical protein PLICRDRAFT_39272 [Plicaturopsis crispa FD-325 SS-3]|nr:hypothetical protein PLICRDRAFT_39272 [Plicaturopsis crispa FD-325 SS-3]
MARIVTVFGSTGTQGSSVISALLADGTFTPRAVTRNVSSEASQKLKARGVEVVQGDLWDKESLKKALAGSEGVFGVTNFYDPTIAGQDPQGEITQGKNLIEVSKEVGVKFFIWSSLPDSTKLSNGKYPTIHHFNNKAAIDEYLKTAGLPYAIVHTGWFAENLWNFGNLVKTADGSFELPVPRYSATSPQAITWIERDLGPSILALLKNYNTRAAEVLGQTFFAVTARSTYPAFAEILSKAFGKPVKFTSPPTTTIRELDEMYEYQSEVGLYNESPLPDPRLVALGVKFSTLEEFAAAAKSRFV